MKDGVDEAYELGAKGLAFPGGEGGEDPGKEKTEQGLNLLVSSTKEICKFDLNMLR